MYEKLIYGNYYTRKYINEYFNVNIDDMLIFYEYSLSTKQASDIDVTRYNELDNTEVFKVLPPSLDLSGANTGIDVEHWFIHKGLHFFNSQCLEITANTKYLLRMQNLVNEINYTNSTHYWYENGL